MDKEDLTENQSKDGLLLVKGQPFAELSESFAPSELFQTSSPTMSHCCELICHVNLMQQNANRLQSILAKNKKFAGDYLHGEKSFRHIYTPPSLHPDWPGSFLADDSVCTCVTRSRSVAVTKYVMIPWVLLPLASEELLVFFLGVCKAQPDTFHRVTYLTQLEKVRVLLFLLGRGAISPSSHTGSTSTLINLTMDLQSKIMLSSYLPTRSSAACVPSPPANSSKGMEQPGNHLKIHFSISTSTRAHSLASWFSLLAFSLGHSFLLNTLKRSSLSV